MTSSMGRILVAVLAVVGGGGAVFFVVNNVFVRPYREATLRRDDLEDEVGKRELQQRAFEIDRAGVAKWSKLSLPSDPNRAAADYGKMLKPLLRDCGLTVDDFQGPSPQETSAGGVQKKPRHVVLPFQIRAKGTMESLAKTLEALQRIPVMHRVKTLVVDRLDARDSAGKLGIQMTIEAMIVAGANNTPKLAGLEALGPAVTNRSYQDLALRNPFVGALPPPPPPPPPAKKDPPPEVVEEPPPSGPDVLEFIRIDTIVPSSNEAFLRNTLYKSAPLRLRSTPMSGYDTFRITSEDRSRVLLCGKVLRIDPRDVYFQVGEDVYAIHFGQTLADALNRPLPRSQLDALELTSLIDSEFAKETADAKKGKKTPVRKFR